MALEHLMDAANSALRSKDKNIASEITDALCSFTVRYGRKKAHMHWTWFMIPEWLKGGPDFLTLSDEALGDLQVINIIPLLTLFKGEKNLGRMEGSETISAPVCRISKRNEGIMLPCGHEYSNYWRICCQQK
jgi:hypothetical protein